MSRYKDVDELKKRMLSVFEDDGIGVVLNGYWSSKLVREIIDEQPTADVVEVVHGKWTTNFGEFPNICCVCNKQAREKTEYCPHCGARMDGGR